ncbi:hypothetical protein PHYPSEUDO_001703 [Phytophthora pseudosyringae]|uniref:Uncharacterized protein n=1 Tax=Phytophthora pseudosyringae TaxID=221518 RepID=A0A8T1W007_9STRA|nr:hypothetical protein PHYPSEUDO_001703 [Phytophthora pseudosyringae]
MTQVVSWKDGELVDKAKMDKSLTIRLCLKTEEEAGNSVLYLYDGPPAQMVCFSSPNDKWFNKLKKNPKRPKLTMPLWGLEELQTAAEEMNLTLTTPLGDETLFNREELIPAHDAAFVADLIEQRFNMFGGVARECLATDVSFVTRRENLLTKTIANFDDMAYLRSVRNRKDANEAHYCICHYVPSPRSAMDEYTVAEPTTFMRRLLMQRLSEAPIHGHWSVNTDPAMAALIFIVPERNFAKFGPQEIELEASTDEDSMGKLNHIGKKREGALNTAWIATIGDLRARLVAEETKKTAPTAKIAYKLSLQTLRRLLTQHDEKHHWSGLKTTFASIPQFVWKTNLEPKYLADNKSAP